MNSFTFNKPIYLIIAVLLFLESTLLAQELTITGKVTDAVSNEPIPYATVRLPGTATGTSCDFEGKYVLKTLKKVDSIQALNLGYNSKNKALKKSLIQVVNFQLSPITNGLREVTIIAGEDPSIPIIKKAIARKDLFNITKLKAYQLENYSKVEIDVDHISNYVRKRKILKSTFSIMDSLKTIRGEDALENFPMFFSETISDLFYTSIPIQRKKEIIKASKIRGVGIKNGEMEAQFTGGSFQEYNFNNNKVFLFGKEFLSPIAEGAMPFYHYYLLDSTYIDGIKSFKIRVKPRNDQDLAFTGNIWIADTAFALVRVNVEIPKTANLNFIDKYQIQVEIKRLDDSVWFPVKSRGIINFADISKKLASIIVKTNNSCKNIIVNLPKDDLFYENKIQINEDALVKADSFWAENRHEKLSTSELNVYNMIDSVKNVPLIRSTTDVFYAIINQYLTIRQIDLGPFYTVYGYNNYQGHRIRLGFRTNPTFSREWVLRGYLSMGNLEKVLHYNAQVEKIISRERWTVIGFQRRDDIDQLGYQYNFDDNPVFYNQQSSLYNTFSEITGSALFNQKIENRIWIERQFPFGLTPRLSVNRTDYKALFELTLDQTNPEIFSYTTTELNLDVRFAFDEYFIQKGNRRVRLGTINKPVVMVSLIQGFKGILGSDVQYTKINLNYRQRLRMNIAGYSLININAGKIFSTVPPALLEIHRGNQTHFYAGGTFNLMNNSEFLSDYYVSLNYQHHFEGLLFNRIPLVRKLKLRELITLNGVYGGLSNANSGFNINQNFSTLNKIPYLEGSAGIENILKLFRVDFLYRFTYIDQNYRTSYIQSQINQGKNKIFEVPRFGIKISINFLF